MGLDVGLRVVGLADPEVVVGLRVVGLRVVGLRVVGLADPGVVGGGVTGGWVHVPRDDT